jgi:hypothetical protein
VKTLCPKWRRTRYAKRSATNYSSPMFAGEVLQYDTFGGYKLRLPEAYSAPGI